MEYSIILDCYGGDGMVFVRTMLRDRTVGIVQCAFLMDGGTIKTGARIFVCNLA